MAVERESSQKQTSRLFAASASSDTDDSMKDGEVLASCSSDADSPVSIGAKDSKSPDAVLDSPTDPADMTLAETPGTSADSFDVLSTGAASDPAPNPVECVSPERRRKSESPVSEVSGTTQGSDKSNQPRGSRKRKATPIQKNSIEASPEPEPMPSTSTFSPPYGTGRVNKFNFFKPSKTGFKRTSWSKSKGHQPGEAMTFIKINVHDTKDKMYEAKAKEAALFEQRQIEKETLVSVAEVIPGFFLRFDPAYPAAGLVYSNFMEDIRKLQTHCAPADNFYFTYVIPATKIHGYKISVLYFRQSIFEKSPNVPVAFYIHRNPEKLGHQKFLRDFFNLMAGEPISPRKKHPKDSQGQKSQKRASPTGQKMGRRIFLICSNGYEFSRGNYAVNPLPSAVTQLKKNCEVYESVERYLRNVEKSPPAEMAVTMGEVVKLFSCESTESFNEKLAEMSQLWSEEFVVFFKSFVKHYLARATDFFPEIPLSMQEEIFSDDPLCHVESVKTVLADIANMDRCPLSHIVLSLYELCRHYERVMTEARFKGPTAKVAEFQLREYPPYITYDPVRIRPTYTPDTIVHFVTRNQDYFHLCYGKATVFTLDGVGEDVPGPTGVSNSTGSGHAKKERKPRGPGKVVKPRRETPEPKTGKDNGKSPEKKAKGKSIKGPTASAGKHTGKQSSGETSPRVYLKNMPIRTRGKAATSAGASEMAGSKVGRSKASRDKLAELAREMGCKELRVVLTRLNIDGKAAKSCSTPGCIGCA